MSYDLMGQKVFFLGSIIKLLPDTQRGGISRKLANSKHNSDLTHTHTFLNIPFHNNKVGQ